MIPQLQKVFQNMTRSMEVFFVMHDAKPCARIAVNEAIINAVEAFCSANNLFFEKSSFKIAMEFLGAYSTKGRRLSPDSNIPGYFFYYISKSGETAKKAKKYEETLDYKKFGQILGYPDCCIDFFVKHKPEEVQKKNDYVMPALENSEGYVFPYENNIFVRYFDISVLSHSPCRFLCEKSKAIAQKNLALLEEHDPNVYAHTENMLKTAAIYSDLGIILLKGKRSKIRKDTFVFSEGYSSQPNKTQYFLEQSLNNGKNRIKINPEDQTFEVNKVKINHPILVFE